MNTWTKSHQKKIAAEKSRWKESLGWVVLGVVLGIFLTTAFNQWGAPLLPGPHVVVNFSGLRITQGNPSGCTAYNLQLTTDEQIDSSYLKIALPQNVKDVQVGRAAQAMTPPLGPVSMQAWEIGRNPNGECYIRQSVLNLTEGISSVATANVLAVRTSNIQKDDVVMGEVVVDSSDSAMKSKEPIFDGNYQYTKWGITIRKKLVVHHLGISDAK